MGSDSSVQQLPQKASRRHLESVRGLLGSQYYLINYTMKQTLVSYPKEFSLGLISLQRSLKLQKNQTKTKQTSPPTFCKDNRTGSVKVII